MKLYLAGPMRGIKLFNFPAFFEAAMELRDQDHIVANPAERDMAQYFNPAEAIDSPSNSEVFSLPDAFEWDFNAILNADAIAMLPGWTSSKGAQAELVVAFNLGKELYEYFDGELKPLDTLKGYTITFE